MNRTLVIAAATLTLASCTPGPDGLTGAQRFGRGLQAIGAAMQPTHTHHVYAHEPAPAPSPVPTTRSWIMPDGSLLTCTSGQYGTGLCY